MFVKPHLIDFELIEEPRGNLSYLEELKHVPFEVKRVYWLTEVPEQQTRGEHAHRSSQQVIICMQGMIEVILEHRNGEILSYTLNQPTIGLFIPLIGGSVCYLKRKGYY